MKSYVNLIFGILAIIFGATQVIFAPYLGVLLGIIGMSLSATIIWNYFADEVLYDYFNSNFRRDT